MEEKKLIAGGDWATILSPDDMKKKAKEWEKNRLRNDKSKKE